MKYDYLIVGTGLYGAVFAHEAKAAGKSVMMIDKRPNIAGNVYTKKVEGINVHEYGAHIFQQRRSLGLRQPFRDLQPLYQLTRRQLQGRALFAALQYVYLQ